ncbi:TIGR01458 family HAD-type hydrolase [Nitrosophilus alvini]|uniref:TIGR01458 family HAD-type hydrolase n=1 Tax=Nitrosophilus alvini TaxID=2714855 RepID=UPI00190A28F2|nr:TIGR01458 family HAD-type hydrolase [Nitrosophilus alvini]
MKVKGVLLDIAGVLYEGDREIKGAAGILEKLKKSYQVRLVTNTSRNTPESVYKKLVNMGFGVKRDEIFTALDAARRVVAESGKGAYMVMTDEAEEFFKDIIKEDIKYVIVADAYNNFTYERLNKAFRKLLEGAELLAVAKNRYFKDKDGKLSMDAGGFVKALEYAAETKATIVGKPSPLFFENAIKSMGLGKDEVIMVGDDIESDIKGAQDIGIKAVLVKTGKYKPEVLDKGIKPDFIIEDITCLPSVLYKL